jgi:hypothetical protein
VNESTRYEIRLNGTVVGAWKDHDTMQHAEREAAIIRRRVPKQDLVQVFKVTAELCDSDADL